jgi:hypothetical protein
VEAVLRARHEIQNKVVEIKRSVPKKETIQKKETGERGEEDLIKVRNAYARDKRRRGQNKRRK